MKFNHPISVGVVFAPFIGLLGCGGGQTWRSDMSWSAPEEPQKKALRETELLDAPKASSAEGSSSSKLADLIGVRHDLSLANASVAARCNCLAWEVGAPDDSSKFMWETTVPRNLSSDVLALALRSTACPSTNKGASILGQFTEGDDVIIEVELLEPGRPLASGVLIPKPHAGARVRIRPASAKVPYGRGSECSETIQ